MQSVSHKNLIFNSKFSYCLRSKLFPNLTQFRSSSTRTGETLQYICRSSHVGFMEIKLHTHSTETGLLMQVSGVLAREISVIALTLMT
jgi:hypothetical protein